MLTSGTSETMSLYFLSFEVSYSQSGSRRRSAPEALSLSTSLIMWSWVCIIFALPKSQSFKWPSSATNRFSGCSATHPCPAHPLYFDPRLEQKNRLPMEVGKMRITKDRELAHDFVLFIWIHRLSQRHPLDYEGSAGLRWGDPRPYAQALPSWASRDPLLFDLSHE